MTTSSGLCDLRAAGERCACGPSEPFNLAAWWRVGIGLLIAGNSMTLSLAVNTSDSPPSEVRVVHGILFGLAVLSLAVLGWPLARNAVRALRDRRITIEAMFISGLVGAMTASLVASIEGRGDVYFEIVTILLVVYAFGQQLTAQVQDRALQAAVEWSPEMTRCSVISDDGSTVEIPVAELEAGQRVFVPPGGSIAADGIVDRGEAFVREAEMTGEPFVVVRRPGDRVWAGTLCVDASLTVRATADGRHRRIDRILDAVERARLVPSTLQSQADRLVARFLPAVLTTAALTFAAWTWFTDWSVALFNAMAVLLVACPCALGLATPLAVWAGLGRLAGRGLVVTSADAVETLARVDAVVFDKTGTITEPKARLVDLVVDPPPGLDRDRVMSLVRVVESASRHPLASAFDDLESGFDRSLVVDHLEVLPALGIQAAVTETGVEASRRVVIGTADRLMADDPAGWQRLLARVRDVPGARRIAVLVDGEPAALAVVDEHLRDSWLEALQELREAGLTTLVFTGDTSERARLAPADRVAAGLSPKDKLEKVGDLRSAGRSVLFVGDGVNDAAAMAASDVSIGVASGAELAAEVAQASWHGEDLRVMPWAIGIARRTVAVIRSNLTLAAAYNVVGITLAVAGILHPVAAALLMTCSSIVVTWRAIAVLQEQEREELAGRAEIPDVRRYSEGVAA